jgi:hypothetical protein
MLQNDDRLFPNCYAAAICWTHPCARITTETVVKDYTAGCCSGKDNMSLSGIGITELMVVGGLVVMAGHIILIGAAVVAAIVIWREES